MGRDKVRSIIIKCFDFGVWSKKVYSKVDIINFLVGEFEVFRLCGICSNNNCIVFSFDVERIILRVNVDVCIGDECDIFGSY